MASNPLYLVKNRLGIFYVQIRNPKHLTSHGSSVKVFFRKSLRTRDLKIAIQKARWYVFVVDDLKRRYWNSEEEYGRAQILLMRYEGFYGKSWESVEQNVLAGLDEGDADLLEKALSFQKLLARLNNSSSSAQSVGHEINPSDPNGLHLSVLLEKYIDDSRMNWSNKSVEKTERSAVDAINILIEVNKDCLASELTKRHIVAYKECLLKLPSNRKKIAAYKDIPAEKFVHMNIPSVDVLSDTTKKNHVTRVKTFLKWCERNGYTCSGLGDPLYQLFKQTQRDDEQRDPFSDSDIQSLFGSNQYVNGKHKLASHYWVPLLALFTGARQTELCQLYVKDIEYDESLSIWFVFIDDDLDRSLKNKGSKRFIPLHSTLIELGFLEFVQSKSTAEKLFPECVASSERISLSHKFQKWFNRTYLNSRNCNIQSKKKSFHSFRHTVSNHLKQKGFSEQRVGELLGHKHGSTITFARYAQVDGLEVKRELIEALQFNIDFDKIKRWKQ